MTRKNALTRLVPPYYCSYLCVSSNVLQAAFVTNTLTNMSSIEVCNNPNSSPCRVVACTRQRRQYLWLLRVQKTQVWGLHTFMFLSFQENTKSLIQVRRLYKGH
jgi:hypothetical protein